MAHYQAILAYDGTAFLGWQRQAQGRTVQGEVEAALQRLGWQERTLRYAGRTDTGVHALGQVIAFALDWPHGTAALQRALNAHLPADVVVRRVALVEEGFHPRYAALARRYWYYLYQAPQRDPFQARYAWRVWPPLEGERLQEAAAALAGRRDFAALGTPPNPRGTTVRTVFKASWYPRADGWVFDVVADAFLYRMVRRMVALQVAVAQGRMSLARWQRLLREPPPNLVQGLAPPQGLFLAQVCYRPEERTACESSKPPEFPGLGTVLRSVELESL
ncbi:MAG TPA: tRNA pseudouridine(38-40) synthase TruA [Anaerolineae bacterium]|nr:tRNA pseudouridine(38-40) synthase TruA [Anaerolineae bacterium]HID84700.1 tRNA pseudouridine(38-40) synthase TruA [Anaerolineales bacterium]